MQAVSAIFGQGGDASLRATPQASPPPSPPPPASWPSWPGDATLCSRLLPPSAPTDLKATPSRGAIRLCWKPPANFGCVDEVGGRLGSLLPLAGAGCWRGCHALAWRAPCRVRTLCRVHLYKPAVSPPPSHAAPLLLQYRVTARRPAAQRSFGAAPLLWSVNKGGCLDMTGLEAGAQYIISVESWSQVFGSGGSASIQANAS